MSGGGTERQVMLLKDFRANVICATPSYALNIAEVAAGMGVELRSDALRIGVFGAEPWSEAMRKSLQERLGVKALDHYGLSEMQGPGVGGECEAQAGLHGWEDHFLFEIVDPKTLRPLPAGESGEILCRSDAVMAGYWQSPEATADALRGGHLHTGDIGAFDPEGYLTLKDRSKDMIISGGSNIYPREIEEVLLKHPRVREVSVIGRPDREWGESVVAYVVGDAPPAELDALCLAAIARFKRPKDYVFIDELPKNNYGKILKTELRARDAQRGLASAGHNA
jgi:acyl-CoA synthetase (AMP-forming)/AMP-acid ligase II